MNGPARYRTKDLALIKERSRSFDALSQDPDPECFLPVSQPTYLVLLALAGPPLPDYQLMKALLESANGKDRLLPGTLIATLGQLACQGLLEEMAEPSEPAAGPEPRCYRVTPLGEAVLLAESGRRRRSGWLAYTSSEPDRAQAPSPTSAPYR